MITRTNTSSYRNEDKAIHEILLKILEKWRCGFLRAETDSEELHKATTAADPELSDPSDEEIVTETVLLRPEDFHKSYVSQNKPDNIILKTGNEVTDKAHEVLNSNTFEKTGGDVPETVIVDSNMVKTDKTPESDDRQEEIPETKIFYRAKDNDE